MTKILIADDSKIMRKNLRDLIESIDLSVIDEAKHGKEAVKKYKELKPDVVTLDITMPIMDGIEALKEIIKYDENAKVIIISALNQKSRIVDALKYGAKEYILKPLTIEKIKKSFNKILNSSDGLSKKEKLKLNFDIKNNGNEIFITLFDNITDSEISKINNSINSLSLMSDVNIIVEIKMEKQLERNFEIIYEISNKIKKSFSKMIFIKKRDFLIEKSSFFESYSTDIFESLEQYKMIKEV